MVGAVLHCRRAAPSGAVRRSDVAAGFVSSARSVGRDDWITGPLDTLSHPKFMVGVRILSRGATQPRRAAVTAGVISWLDSLDRDDVAARPVDDFPRFCGRAAEWEFQLTALPMKTETRRDRRRLVGLYPGGSGWDNTVTALRAALKGEGGQVRAS